MKKIIAFLLVAVMAFSFAACGGVDTPEVTDGSGNTENTDSTTGTTGVESGKTDGIDFEQIKSFEDIPVISEKDRWILKTYIEEVTIPGVILHEDRFFDENLTLTLLSKTENGKLYTAHFLEAHVNWYVEPNFNGHIDVIPYFRSMPPDTYERTVLLIENYFGDRMTKETRDNEVIHSIDTTLLTQDEAEKIYNYIHTISYMYNENYKTFADERKDTPIPEETTATTAEETTGTATEETTGPVIVDPMAATKAGIANLSAIKKFEDVPEITPENKAAMRKYIEEYDTQGIVLNKYFIYTQLTMESDISTFNNVDHPYSRINFNYAIDSFTTQNPILKNFNMLIKKEDYDIIEKLFDDYFNDELLEVTKEGKGRNLKASKLKLEEIDKILNLIHAASYSNNSIYRYYVNTYYAENGLTD